MMKHIFTIVLITFLLTSSFAQDDNVAAIQINFKNCQRIKKDSVPCFRVYYNALDSALLSVFSKVSAQLPADEKADLLKEQLSWNVKKDVYFKKQDENFVYNLNEGTWTKDMIRLVYEEKADYLLKRIRLVQKRLSIP